MTEHTHSAEPTFEARLIAIRYAARDVNTYEFARPDGAPLLDQRSQYVTWARVLNAEYERLKRESWMGRPTVLDEYGTTDPAEFFAVATECFFEKPRALEKRHPKLYSELQSFYRQDPARLLPASSLTPK